MKRKRGNFKVFLSHRYEASEVNLFFWNALRKAATFTFEVDPKKIDNRSKPTNVTRLEMIIQRSDAFVGIFSAPKDHKIDATRQETAYFRLEAELAMRARKPTLLFLDDRYRSVFTLPAHFHGVWYDNREIETGLNAPAIPAILRAIDLFTDELLAAQSYQSILQRGRRSTVGVVTGDVSSKEVAVETLRNFGLPYEVVDVFAYDSFAASDLDKFLFCFVDVGDAWCRLGVPAFLEGLFVPQIRAANCSKSLARKLVFHKMHSGIDKGYLSDLIYWETLDELREELEWRLKVIQIRGTYVSNNAQAEEYFSEAVLREERVFISAAGSREEFGRDLEIELRRFFRKGNIFFYKSPGAMLGGKEWEQQVFRKLSEVEIGVIILSPDYFEREHCKAEYDRMIERWNGGTGDLVLLPVKQGRSGKLSDSVGDIWIAVLP